GKMQTLRQYDGNDYLIQFYSQWRYNVSDRFTINSGIHALRYFINNQYSVEPRLGGKYNFSSKKSLTAGFGFHSQLQPTEVYYSQAYNYATAQYVRTNTNLGFSKSFHAVMGYEQMLRNDIRFKVEVYRQELYNIPIDGAEKNAFSILNFGADFAALPARDSLVNNGKGNNTGIEITIEKYFSKGFYWLFTSSFFDSKYTPSIGKEFNTAFNGKYVINGLAGYEYKCGKKKNNILSINLKSTVAGGRRFTPIDLPASQQAGEVRYNWNLAYSEQFKTYFRADIRIGFKLNAKRVTQEWAIDIQNAFNSQNPLQQSFDIKDGSIKVEYQQGFLPIALYRIQF
ncbi:MAG: TonB-dependent receptor, partial [Bacteroidetes bacterium]|nr:TonB-dependent receptor [Bacteroidota bacterium]